MYLSAYEEAENETNVSKKIAILKQLSGKIARECPSSSWYDFVRGMTLFYEKDYEKAFETVEKAFLKDKNIVYCEKMVQMYTDADDSERVKEWTKKRDNLRIFEREHIDVSKIEEQQCVLKEQLRIHDENQITLAIQYIRSNIKKKKSQSCLKILKRWSSSTPLLARGIGANIGNGGGIYIRWKNKGIVIDPGINFIQNMNDKEISVLDVDYVIITHDHIDHNNDLLAIMDIKYQCILAAQQMTDLSSAERKWISRDIKYYMDPTTELHFQKDIKENKCCVTALKKGLRKGKLERLQMNADMDLCYFSTEHIRNQDTYGIVLKLHDSVGSRQVGYTSDTKYFPELCDYFQEADYIIANLSEITITDLEKREYKHNHLGYQGCYDLVTNPKIYCKYFILSEFWGGKGDIRNIIADYLKNECLKKRKVMRILPGDVNLSFDLVDDSIKCCCCGKYYTERDIKIECSDNCIEYLCSACAARRP